MKNCFLKWVVLLAGLCVLQQQAQAQNGIPLLEDVGDPHAPQAGDSPFGPAGELRGRAVRVVPDLRDASRIDLNLFPDVRLEAVGSWIELQDGESLVWQGSVVDEPLSLVTLAFHGNAVAGVIDRPLENGNAVYVLTPGPDDALWLSELPGNADVPCEVLSVVDAALPPEVDAAEDVTPASQVIVDVMVVYTPATRTRHGTDGVQALIAQAVADANRAYLNSGVLITLSLVHSAEVSYVETGSLGTTLSRLQTPNDGYMDAVHGWRDLHRADVVILLSQDSSACGIAYLMTPASSSFAPYAFGVVYSSCIAQYSFAHELGHTMGCAHDRANASGPGAYPYSYGHRRCIGDTTGFRTVMSYPCSSVPRVNYFSTPLISLNGFPLGVSYQSNPTNAADNARSLNNTAPTVAAFRGGSTGVPAAPANLAASATSSSSIRISWTDGAANETSFKVERSSSGQPWTQIASLAAGSVSYTDSGLAAGSTHSYRVRACNANGCSAYSNVASAALPIALPAPTAPPTSLTAAVLSSTQVRLNWADKSANESGFKIERARGKSGFRQIAVTGPNATAFTDNNLRTRTTYSYRLRATGSNGDSAYSNMVTVQTP